MAKLNVEMAMRAAALPNVDGFWLDPKGNLGFRLKGSSGVYGSAKQEFGYLCDEFAILERVAVGWSVKQFGKAVFVDQKTVAAWRPLEMAP